MVPRRVIFALCAIWLTGSAQADELDSAVGKAIFERQWVGAPASTKSADGLGPLFDARACSSCHQGGGAGKTALQSGDALAGSGFIIRLGNDDPAYADPVYGTQLQMRALQGQVAEAHVALSWLAQGTLRVPKLTLDEMGYGALSSATKLSLRRAPSLKEVELIAQIPERDILARADADDENRDGISGRANWLTDQTGAQHLGRFGWKAGEATLLDQTTRALSRDMGLSTSLMPAPWGECTKSEPACRNAPQGGTISDPEVPDGLVHLITRYLATLSPPKRALNEAGGTLFQTTGCASCHSGNIMSDLLLHDMGDGLADGVAEGSATAREWRTAPLVDIAASLERGGLLHDGRARSIAEAVEWHDGEANHARTAYRALEPDQQQQLTHYLLGE